MKRVLTGLFVVVVLLLGAAVALVVGTKEAEQAPEGVAEEAAMEKPARSTASASKAPSPKGLPRPMPASEPVTAGSFTISLERPPPPTPAMEGLYALADAGGQALTKCALDAFPEGAAYPTPSVEHDGHVWFPVEAAASKEREDGTIEMASSTVHFAGDPAYSIQVDAALPGMGPGRCTIRASEGMVLSAEEMAFVMGKVAEQATETLDEAAEAMDPAQVALDTPGLSEEAKAWLQEHLEETVELAEKLEASKE